MTEGYWQDELPGILNWALAGLARLRARGRFDLPAACRGLLADHRRASDPAREFLDKRVEYTGVEQHRVEVGYQFLS